MDLRKLLILSGLLCLPVLLCWGLASSLARSDDAAFATGVVAQGAVVEVRDDRVRFDGRDAQEVTEVRVQFTPQGADAPVVATAEVWSASGLVPGAPMRLRYLPADPTKIQLDDGLWRRSSPVVFLTLFGGFWLALDVVVSAGLFVLLRRRAA